MKISEIDAEERKTLEALLSERIVNRCDNLSLNVFTILRTALDASLCPTKPAPAPHPAQSAEVERAPVAEAGRADFMLVLQAHAERLNHLLKNPEPGLSTWAKFFGQEVQWFSDYWAGKFANP